MGFDANIALGVKPVEIESPLNALAKALQIQKLGQDYEIGQIGIADKQRAQKESNALNLYLSQNPNFDITNPDHRQQVMAAAPTTGMGFLDKQSSMFKNTSQGASAKATADKIAQESKLKDSIDAAYRVYQDENPQMARATIMESAKAGKVPQDWAAKNLAELDKIESIEDPAQAQAAHKAWQDSHAIPLLKQALVKNGQYDQALSYDVPKAGVVAQQQGLDNRANLTDQRARDLAEQRRVTAEKLREEKKQAGAFDPETITMMAQQALTGDKSVFNNLGRGNQGAENIAALRKEMNRQMKEADWNGKDIAAKNQEFAGLTAAQRTAGVASANAQMATTEALDLSTQALEASKKVVRSGFLPFGKGNIMFNENTNNPEMREFAVANNGLVNTYARAINPKGVGTVADKEHAREILSTAFDQKSYEAAVMQMRREMEAALKSPEKVRRALSGEVSGRKTEEHGSTGGFKYLGKEK